MVVAFVLEIANLVGFLLGRLYKGGSNNRFQVTAAASHFRDQGSLTVGCFRLPFLRLLTRRGGGGGGGGSTV